MAVTLLPREERDLALCQQMLGQPDPVTQDVGCVRAGCTRHAQWRRPGSYLTGAGPTLCTRDAARGLRRMVMVANRQANRKQATLAETAAQVLRQWSHLPQIASVDAGATTIGSPGAARSIAALQIATTVDGLSAVAQWAQVFGALVRFVRNGTYVGVSTEAVVDGHVVAVWDHLRLEEHLPRAVTLFWFAAPDPDAGVPRQLVIQPTTLLELGVALGEGRPIAVGVDPMYPRPDILEYQLAMYPHITLHHTLRETVLAAVQLLDQPPADRAPVADVRTKLTGLSRTNTRALEELLTDDEKQRVKIGKTVVEFAMPVEEAGLLVGAAQQRAKDRNAHPYKSLHAVLRRLAEAGEVRG